MFTYLVVYKKKDVHTARVTQNKFFENKNKNKKQKKC